MDGTVMAQCAMGPVYTENLNLNIMVMEAAENSDSV